MILLVDNYDSFSYNLYQMIGALNADIRVVRNDALSVDEVAALAPSHIILSPGPGRPEEAGICIEIVRQLGASIPLLGVCLGHQAIAAAFGATVTYAQRLMHGKQSLVQFDTDSPLFAGLPKAAPVARYHSLAVAEDTLPDALMPVAQTLDGAAEVMALQHTDYPIYGVQFHPESIMTPDGAAMLKNFLAVRSDAQ
ncbi:MAG: aminodeoxychorismate/anthranilate synthase component II [Peptococcaceae bacterium]|nr:aminodeoxychorismate/anthranilate synthase component II [Peptococcaceae bacterium]